MASEEREGCGRKRHREREEKERVKGCLYAGDIHIEQGFTPTFQQLWTFSYGVYPAGCLETESVKAEQVSIIHYVFH